MDESGCQSFGWNPKWDRNFFSLEATEYLSEAFVEPSVDYKITSFVEGHHKASEADFTSDVENVKC